MKEVFIKYNPYKLETEITVDGKRPAMNSQLREKSAPGNRLQEWVEELPELLVDEYNDNQFSITFHGIIQDCDDIVETFQKAYNSGKIKPGKIDIIHAKETADKEKLIDEVFAEILNGPFEELKSEEVKKAFHLAKSEDFEICVVATMSAGKSTLINSMLGTKLMPSKQKACTAIITKIKDTDSKNWRAVVYDRDSRIIETQENITLDTMTRLNSDKNVSTIEISGDIPFVKSDDVSLVLIDTPGPNNSRDPEHGIVQRKFLSSSSKSLVLYIMTSTFGNDDDNSLLNSVAKSMKVNGKQSKDRFIFVVNKMDDRRSEDGETSQTLDRVREYLRNHGIENPNLFPAAALPALNIHQVQNGDKLDEDTIDETELQVRKLNRNEQLHFEDFSPLSKGVKGKIKEKLAATAEQDDKNTMALIHTGVPSIEAAIRQYVQKYAKTAKVKNIVDTFIGRLEAAGSMENTKKAIVQDKEKADKIIQQIKVIEKKINDIRSTNDFEDRVEKAIIDSNDMTRDCVEEKINKFQTKITRKIDKFRGKRLELSEIESKISGLESFSNNLEKEIISELNNIIKENLISTAQTLINEYHKKLESLADEIDLSYDTGIKVSPLNIMKGSFSNPKFNISKHIQTEEVEDGEEYVANTNKKWYKPWTWFQEKGYFRTKYKTVKYVDGSELAQAFFAPINKAIVETGEAARKHASSQSNQIIKYYKNRFAELDDLLNRKLQEIKNCATDKANAEEQLRISEARLKWLENISNKVESILEI